MMLIFNMIYLLSEKKAHKIPDYIYYKDFGCYIRYS